MIKTWLKRTFLVLALALPAGAAVASTSSAATANSCCPGCPCCH